MFGKVKHYIRSHRIISAIVVVVLCGGAYYWYSSSNAAVAVTKYVVENATQGTVVSSVSGSGQVQAGATIVIAAKVSEVVTSIPVKVGDHVVAGQLLVQLDATTEQRALNQAQLSLEQAQLSAQQSEQVATTTLIQQQNTVTSDEQAAATASSTLAQDYASDFNSLGATFVNLQTVMTGLKGFALGYDLSKNQQDADALVTLLSIDYQSQAIPYVKVFGDDYNLAVAAYQKNLADYQAATSNASTGTMDALFSETYNTTQSASQAVKAGKDLLDYVVNAYQSVDASKPLPSVVTTLQSSFSSYRTTMNTAVSNVQATITGIANDRNNIVATQNSLRQASETLSESIAGPTQATVLSNQISVQTAQNNFTTAEQNLANTSVRAPIAGVVAALTATVGAAPGASPVTIVGEGEVAQITLNENDAAKVQVGDKATLTFDAISGLSLAGTVAEIDPVGTVSQGVVSYNAQISFSQPANTSSSLLVRPGMSVTANIVTQVDQNVIAVPNVAVTTTGGVSRILEPATALSAAELSASTSGGAELSAAPKSVTVTTGLSNDTLTEITSGVNVGDQIIVRTIKSTSAATAKTGVSATSILTGGARAGGFGGGGGNVRVGGGG